METVLYEYGFDFKDFSTNFIPLIVGLGFLHISIMLTLHKEEKPVPYKDKMLIKPNNTFFKVIGYIVGPLAILMSITGAWGMLSEHFELKERVARENLYVVEGYVENYHPMPREGHDLESFEINGVYFEYSDFKVINGYNNSASHGGVVTRNGQYLKIKYVTKSVADQCDENVILYIAEVEPLE